MTGVTVPAAGWYPDRNDAKVVRWWDGQQWTDQTQSAAPAVAAFEQPVSVDAFGFVPPEQNPVAQDPAAQYSATRDPATQYQATQYQATQNPIGHYPLAQGSAAQAVVIAPGWYPDNADPSLQRWWDGAQWTTHTAPGVAGTQPYGGSAGSSSSANNGLATLALVFSIASFGGLLLGLLLVLSLPGLIIGIVALRRARRFAGGAGRRGQAVAAIVVGAVSVVMTVFLFVFAIQVYQHVHGTNPGQTSVQQSQSGGFDSGTGSDPRA